MPVLLVAATEAHAGKTGFAAAITRRLVYDGRRALALRLGAGGDPAASADAAFFATLPGARGRGGQPILPADATAAISTLASADIAVLEAPETADLPALAETLDAAVLLVQRGVPDASAVETLRSLAQRLGVRLTGVALTAVPAALLERSVAALNDAGLPVIAAVPEEKLLYAPTLAEIAAFLPAEFLLGEEEADLVVEELMINPISSDPGQPYYARRRNKAVITRSDKTDAQLAALAGNTDCLILTGGLMPSPYTLDRAVSDEVAVLLTRLDTRMTVRKLEDIYTTTRFGSERKLERMAELLHERLNWDALFAALGLQAAAAS
jgi:BioD-like phosphotransacetylase family protein